MSGVIDNSTGSANVRARFKNDNGMLRSGSTGQILIPNHKENVILIPQKATFEIENRRFVYVVNDSNKTVSTAITVAPENDGQQFIVTNGLKPGERVVVEGVGTKVRDNMPIKPFDAAARAAAIAAQQQQAAPQQ